MRDRSRTRHADDRLANSLESYLRLACIDWPPSLARLAGVDVERLPYGRGQTRGEGPSPAADDIFVALVVIETAPLEDGAFIELGA